MTREELVKKISFTIGMYLGYRPERQAEEVVRLLEGIFDLYDGNEYEK